MLRPLAAVATLTGVALLASELRQDRSLQARDEPILVPFVIDAARELTVVDAALLIVNAAAEEAPLSVEEVTLIANGMLIHTEPVGAALAVDPRYAELQARVERMPHELTHREGPRRFAGPDEPAFGLDELAERWVEIDRLAAELRVDYVTESRRPFVEVHVPLPLDLVFTPADAAGTTRAVEFSVTWRRGNAPARVTRTSATIRRLTPMLPPPDTLNLDLGSVTLHGGDLHVHSCHGEASNACAPSGDCAAESFQTSGSFTYAQLKSQYQALGADWFTATDHSYCINSDSEFQTIVGELAALTDAAFLALPDIELSSEEEGAQQGSDLADLLCLLGPNQNHMGAHGITTRKEGGDDGFLGFCNGLFSDALEPFTPNAASIRAEGGYPIVNHPAGSSFAWNSFASLQGIESNQMHGVEIWNGATQSGQGGGVDAWVQWLLGGRLLYAYSGSDTHDAAFAFGVNQAVFFDEPFDAANLQAILKKGRLFVSNAHVLILAIDLDGVEVPMGQLQSLAPSQPASTLGIDTHYNFGTDTGTITVYRGKVGDVAETVLCTSPPLSGQGVFTCTDVLDPAARTWYRAYSDANAGALTAYTNPVFFLPSSVGTSTYGTGLGGANIASLTSPSSPAIGSLFALDLSGFSVASAQGIVAVSQTQIPGGLPLAGGFLLVAPPFDLLVATPLAGGTGKHVEELPCDVSLVGNDFFAQAAAFDLSQPANLAFSNGLAFTLAGLLQ